MKLSSQDRSALIRFASTLPERSPEKKAILSGLKLAAGENLQQLINKGWVGSPATGWTMVLAGGGLYAECTVVPMPRGMVWTVRSSDFEGHGSSGRPILKNTYKKVGTGADAEEARRGVMQIVSELALDRIGWRTSQVAELRNALTTAESSNIF